MLNDFGVKGTPTTSRNPTVGNVLRTLIHTEPPGTLADAKTLIDSALATASHAVRTNISQATGYSPGALAFHRDMLVDVPLVIDLLQIRDKRRIMVDENLLRINAMEVHMITNLDKRY